MKERILSSGKKLFKGLLPFLLFALFSCSRSTKQTGLAPFRMPDIYQPKGYVCYRTTSPVNPDGILDEKSWAEVPWTDYFVDIEGSVRPLPRFKTHAKLLWDDDNIYIAAELEEPDVWATLRQRDTIIFYDNDFEVFIDPDGDTQAYYELEVNAFGTAWDLLLLKPYRDQGTAVTSWDIAGLKVGVHVDGTINHPGDVDKGWTVEIKIPLTTLKECAGVQGLPKAGSRWRLDFSRVEWKTHVQNGTYVKDINPKTGKPFPEDNWVWSPTGRINMHMPEMWGYLQFSGIVAGEGTEAFIPDPDFLLKWLLRKIYYAENDYYLKFNTYSSNLSEIGLKSSDFPPNLSSPVIESTRSTFESYFPEADTSYVWTIYQDGRLAKVRGRTVKN
jgi:Carbohydrate family 9 binding domain-like